MTKKGNYMKKENLTDEHLIFQDAAKAFFENQVQYAFENRWEPMLGDVSVKKRFKAMRRSTLGWLGRPRML